MPRIGDMFPSKYLAKVDFEKPLVLTMSKVNIEELGQGNDAERKPVLYFHELQKGLVLNVGNSRTIADQYGEDTDDWNGGKVQVYFNPDIEFAGRRTGGLRVRVPSPKQAGGTQRRRAHDTEIEPPRPDDDDPGFDDSNAPPAEEIPF